MQMMQIAFLASPPPQKLQQLNLKNLPSVDPFSPLSFGCVRGTFAGHPPPTPYFLTSFAKHNSTGLLRRLAFVPGNTAPTKMEVA